MLKHSGHFAHPWANQGPLDQSVLQQRALWSSREGAVPADWGASLRRLCSADGQRRIQTAEAPSWGMVLRPQSKQKVPCWRGWKAGRQCWKSPSGTAEAVGSSRAGELRLAGSPVPRVQLGSQEERYGASWPSLLPQPVSCIPRVTAPSPTRSQSRFQPRCLVTWRR